MGMARAPILLALCGGVAIVTGFEVIGAGLRQTGCDELAKALDILGFNTYHSGKDLPNTHAEWLEIMEKVSKDGKKSSSWAPTPKDSLTAADLAPLYSFAERLVGEDGHKAIVSSPAAFYTINLLKKYPKAKVILTEHEDPQEWFAEIQKISQIALHRDMVKAEWHRLRACPLPPADADSPECTGDYIKHNALIRKRVKAQQLLDFKVEDGWEPLCKFLGVPVPKVPFPYGKSQKGVSKVLVGAIGVAVLIVGLLIAAACMSMATPGSTDASKKQAKD